MTVIAVIEAVAIVAVVVAFLFHIRALERNNAEERRMLADRIQRPELLPVREPTNFPEPLPKEDDQMNLVGKIRISDRYGLEDE